MNLKTIERVYFIGIGGIGMSALARYFNHFGKKVAGYDKNSTSITNELINEGISIHYEDDPKLIPDEFISPLKRHSTLVVVTPAIPENHSELNYFKTQDYNILKRAQVLGIIAQNHKCIAVAGTHGKTTTTTLLTHLLNNTTGCNAFLGGISVNYGTNLILNRNSSLMVAEADEFDRSFLSLYPSIAIVTSTDADHLDIYGNHNAVIEAFNQFIQQIQKNGKLIVKSSIINNLQIPKDISVITYSIDNQSDYKPCNIKLNRGLYTFDFITPKGIIEGFTLGVPGLYNLENATAALACCIETGIDSDELKTHLASFRGVKRRFEIRYNQNSKILIDDYAHHPAEIKACINSARQLYPQKHITGIFQPHLYSRTKDFYKEFAAELSQLDRVILLPVYPARELPIQGISSEIIFNLLTCSDKWLIEYENLPFRIAEMPCEVVITMGAGNIDLLIEDIAKNLKN